jgi:hypothetical protein
MFLSVISFPCYFNCTTSRACIINIIDPFLGTLTISSGTYNNTTGIVTLTMPRVVEKETKPCLHRLSPYGRNHLRQRCQRFAERTM